MRNSTHALSVVIKLGFYLDIPIRPWRPAIGIGVSPGGVGGESFAPADGADRIVAKGTDVRVDVAAPVFLLGTLQPRLSVIYTGMTEAVATHAPDEVTAKAAGSGWFVGASVGGTRKGSTILLGVGLQRARFTMEPSMGEPAGETRAVSAWGAGARLLVSWTPSGKLLTYYTPTQSKPQERGNAGCYYQDHCDVDGNCTTQYVCP